MLHSTNSHQVSALLRLREKLGWSRPDLIEVLRIMGRAKPNGEPILSIQSIRSIELGVSTSRRTAALMAEALNYGYQTDRYTTETILELFRQEQEQQRQ